MDEIEIRLQEVRSILFNDPLVKEYLSLKKQISENKYLSDLEKDIVVHEKAMTQNMNNDEIYFSEKEQYESLKEKYDNDPLIINYKTVVEELIDILNEVKQVLM